MASNRGAWLDNAGSPLRVGDAPMPTPGAGEIVIENRAIAINALDWHMQDSGVFVQQWPTIVGCDVAGNVFEVGSGVTRFKKGDRVTAHTINLVTGKPQDAAFALYSVAPAGKAAILPDDIPFTSGAVLPLTLEAAVCALMIKKPGEAMPGVPTPALGLPYPTLDPKPKPLGKTVVVYGASAGVGMMTTQLAVASGVNVIAITSLQNFQLAKTCGASAVFDYKDPAVVDKVIEACTHNDNEFVGIIDAISLPETYTHDFQILSKLGGGHLACTHPPAMENVPSNVKAGMMFAVDDAARPVWEDFVTPALRSGKLKCLPKPEVVGKGLESIQEALKRNKAGVSATKLVVEL